jgi:hypothetical protein
MSLGMKEYTEVFLRGRMRGSGEMIKPFRLIDV